MSKSGKSAARKARREGKRPNSGHQTQKVHDQSAQGEGEEYRTPKVRPSTEPIVPLTESQERYDAAIKRKRVIFGIGSAGTGKTWFAACRAADALRNGEIDRIVLTRPAVEAGENLGALPGELKDKYEPYLAPFLDALEERLGSGHLQYCLRNDIIMPRPLAFMRGVTMKNCWVLADEAQNISHVQMKMLLTRIGVNSKFIVTGDPRQSDLNPGKSGLVDAVARLSCVDGIETIHFGVEDVVRDDICQDIVIAYEK